MSDKQPFLESVIETVTDPAEIVRLARLYNEGEMVEALIGLARRTSELKKRLEVQSMEAIKARAMFEMAVKQLATIKGLLHPEGIMIEGKGYSFHPPDDLVREAWEALSKVIREIDVEKLARGE